MTRARNVVPRLHRRSRYLRRAKGYFSARHRLLRTVKEALMRAGRYAYRDRRARKRVFRSLWIVRLNAAARSHGMTYSSFMHGLRKAGNPMDRKALSELAFHDPGAFAQLVDQSKQALAA
ncbi:MAG: 50S ribosomal protein L20 [Planctomycetota bacterium]|nr:MAG: 50S ribosomal protein L20 [Planctomycetota bacterium]